MFIRKLLVLRNANLIFFFIELIVEKLLKLLPLIESKIICFSVLRVRQKSGGGPTPPLNVFFWIRSGGLAVVCILNHLNFSINVRISSISEVKSHQFSILIKRLFKQFSMILVFVMTCWLVEFCWLYPLFTTAQHRTSLVLHVFQSGLDFS